MPIKKLILTLFLVYSPWHDAYTLGQRGKVSLFSFHSESMTWAGLVNILWILMMMIVVSTSIEWKSIAKCLKSKAQESTHSRALIIFLASSLLLCILNLRHIPPTGIVFVFNWSLWSLLLLVLAGFSPKFLDLFKTSLPKLTIALGISYTLAVILPLLIPIPGWRSPWIDYGAYIRYGGWVGDGQVLGFMGTQLFLWSSVWLYHANRTESRDYLRPFFLALIGLLGVYLNVLRLAWLITSIFGFGILLLHFTTLKKRVKNYTIYLALILAITAFGIGFTTEFRNKTRPLPFDPHGRTKYSELSGEDSQSLMGFLSKVEGIDSQLIHSNGRILTYRILFNQFRKTPIFGIGTGGSKPALKQWKIDYHWPFAELTEPNSDYLRILVEQGVVGFIIWMGVAIALILHLKTTLERLLLFVFAIGLATDAMMILPTIGHGPFLLLLIASRALKSPTS